jgi:hypothetical protein
MGVEMKAILRCDASESFVMLAHFNASKLDTFPFQLNQLEKEHLFCYYVYQQ